MILWLRRAVFVATWWALMLSSILWLAPGLTQAQTPSEFTNLQYFPKDISREQLIGIMRGFSFSLNVRCQYCHAAKEGVPIKDANFASDEKETKRKARAMLRMVDAINQQYIAKLDPPAAHRVECVTCHHGLGKPATMNAVLAETIEKKDIAAAVAQYRDLRKKYYGDGQYDFGETPLNILTESLLKKKNTQEAVAIMELNVEVNAPPSGWAYSLLAMSHAANKDAEKAKADFQKILELNPQDDWAKKQLEELNRAKP
jgi:tetratricopeptide (TPR) repeat protein